MTLRMIAAAAAAAAALVAGCAAGPPPTAAQQADAASCTAAADATYNAQNYEALSRTSQNGLRYSPMPNHVFDAAQMGAMHQRDSEITSCEANGSPDPAGALPGPPPVTPHIVP
jgi:hypothetical protein